MGNALPQGLGLPVPEASYILAHAAGEHLIDGLHNFSAGAEIVAEEHPPPLSRLGLGRRAVSVVLIQEDPRIRQPELIDGLLHIPHQKTILLFPGDAAENGILDGVGVLVFVHQHLPVPLSDFPGSGSWALPAKTQQQIQGFVLQVSEIQDPALLFEGPIFLLEPPHQGDKTLLGKAHLLQVLKKGFRVPGEDLPLLGKSLLAGFPHRLDLLFSRHRVSLLGEDQPAKGNPDPVHCLIPGAALPQVLQLMQRVRQIVLNRGGLPGQLHAALQGGDLSVQETKEVLHQEFPPRGFLRPLRLGQIAEQALIQPALRVRMASGTVIDLGDELRQGFVRPAQALRIREGPKSGVLQKVYVGVVQQILQHFFPKLLAGVLVCHPKVGIQIQPVGVFLQNVSAEAVDCGDFRQIEALQLLLQVLVLRVCRNVFVQFLGNFGP